jgi:hypothetical protein
VRRGWRGGAAGDGEPRAVVAGRTDGKGERGGLHERAGRQGVTGRVGRGRKEYRNVFFNQWQWWVIFFMSMLIL